MARTSTMILIAGLTLLVNSGCGTNRNLAGQEFVVKTPAPQCATLPFGGVVNDLKPLVRSVAQFPNDTAIFCATVLLIDLPFSMVGDVLTLPVATYRWLYPVERPVPELIPPPTVSTTAPPNGRAEPAARTP